MSKWKLCALLALLTSSAGCAAGEDDVGPAEPGENPALPDVLTPRCERLGDLESPADFLQTQQLAVESVGRVEVQIVLGQIANVAGLRCQLVEPHGFSLNGCADWYDCGGCGVGLRRVHEGPYVLTGLSVAPQCLGIRGRYEHAGE